MMKLYLFIKAAKDALLGNKLRSFLTMLGIIIGISAIVIILSVGSGAQSLILNQVNSLGSNLIGVLPGGSEDNGPPATAFGITITTLKQKDIDAVAKQVPGIIATSGYINGIATLTWNGTTIDSTYMGVSPDYIYVEDTNVSQGSFFTREDNETLGRVVVIGPQVYADLFGSQDPLEQKIKINQETFRVIGVMRERGSAAFQNSDDKIFIPLQTAQKLMLGIDHLGFARIKVQEGADIDYTVEEIKSVLRVEHNLDRNAPDDFSVRSTKQALSVLGSVTDVLKFFLAAISAISLLVGGIGIMNIMLVAVLERTREIGLRKALGAKPKDLRIQFLAETLIITLTGSIVGFLVGVVISWLIATVVQYLGYAWDFSIPIISAFLALLFPLAIGIIFGFYPAEKAARLKPIQALHYE